MTKPRNSARRTFLKLLPAAGIAAAGGYLLLEYAPWLNYNEQADRSRKPLGKPTGMPAQVREILRYATLSANAHNAQPWKFVVQPGAVEIHPDYSRCLPIVDPANRELWISLGCTLEISSLPRAEEGIVAKSRIPTLLILSASRFQQILRRAVHCLMQSPCDRILARIMTGRLCQP